MTQREEKILKNCEIKIFRSNIKSLRTRFKNLEDSPDALFAIEKLIRINSKLREALDLF